MITFRTALAADGPALVRLIESAYRGEQSRKGLTTEADLLDGQRTELAEIARLLANPDSRFLLAQTGDKITGCAHLLRCEGYGYFGMFAVSPPEQGAGTGGALLAESERMIGDEWGLPEVRMQVISLRDDLIGYYQRRGYRRTGQFSPFPYGDERYGVPLRGDLRFELLTKRLP